MADLDKQLCSALINADSLEKIQDYNFESDLLYADGRKCYEYILAHYRKFSKLPSIHTIYADTEITLEKAEEPVEYYLQEIIIRRRLNNLRNGMKGIVGGLSDCDPDKSETALKHLLMNIQKSRYGKSDKLLNFSECVEQRKKWYLDKEALGGAIDGIPTPWELLNDITQGWHGGELISIVARLGVGKTFFALLLGDTAFNAGFKPLVVSFEMSPKQLLRRADALHFKIAPRSLRKADLGDIARDIYFEKMDRLKEAEKDYWVAGSGYARTLADIEMLISDKSPDMVIVDAFYLIESSRGYANKSERIAEVVSALKGMAQFHDIPIIITSQFNRDATKSKTGGESEHVSFSDSIMQNSDVGIALLPDDDPRMDGGSMIIKMLKTRDDDGKDFRVGWNLDTVEFPQIGVVEDEVMEEETETVADRDTGIIEVY